MAKAMIGSLRMHLYTAALNFTNRLSCTVQHGQHHPERRSHRPLAAVARVMGYIRAVKSLIESSYYSALDTLVLVIVATSCHCPTVTSIRALYALQEFMKT
ncbi:hypothetical protein M440DRAFT_1422590 [Trichoderma longibrachiatum ATCC 18648]|uniref:Uncharacterized protein n=1 Tax=Trichoderma longibrachiatum ATCC 18648 TaxID=983965 RepID=A0A2T4C4P3_TRILO|nr:hypothetical protein M440DRAFT_1422590 [Trichoderma longibrachiatum ATCC 18648]